MLGTALRLDPHRGFKFLHSLAMSGLLTEAKFERGEDTTEFLLSAESQEYFGASGSEGFFFRDLVAYYRYLNNLNVSLADVVRGADLQGMVIYSTKLYHGIYYFKIDYFRWSGLLNHLKPRRILKCG